LDTFTATLSDDVVAGFVANPISSASSLLGSATNRVVYDLFAYFRTRDSDSPQPALAATIAREIHVSDAATSPIHLGFSYSDGFGRVIQQKARAEPGPGPQRDPNTGQMVVVNGVPQMTATPIDPRWIGSGWTIFNNKGSPVREYEPFFTDTFRFEFAVVIGVAGITFYDPLNREIGQLNPDHTWNKSVFDPWTQEVWDVNDTAQIDPAADPTLGSYFSRLPTTDYLPTWSKQREGGQLGPEEKTAAAKCLVHRDTPGITLFDPLARGFAIFSHSKLLYSNPPSSPAPPSEEFRATRLKLDIEGNQRQTVDAKGRTCQSSDFTMLGKAIREFRLDAGTRIMLHDVSGKLRYSWDEMGRKFRSEYDALHRPILAYVLEAGGSEKLITKTVYGESTPSGDASNLVGKVAQLFDQAGIVTRGYDFKGNQTRSERQLAANYKDILDWAADVPPDATPSLISTTTFDGLNRPATVLTPDGSSTSFTYNPTGMTSSVRAAVKGDANRTVSVDSVEYNAKGQRTMVLYGNGVQTTWDYDPLTFRLRRMRTTRNTSTFPGASLLQDLTYTYDPAGNVTFVKDAAQQQIFFRNQQVDPSNEYTYSSEYRLIEAVGREQLGQAGQRPVPGASPLPTVEHPNQSSAMGTYLEQYVWDAVGNIMVMKHDSSDAKTPGWTRKYTYGDGNKLMSSEVSGAIESYTYDAHGNMLSMPSLPVMKWDYQNQLRSTARQASSNGQTPETTYYTYDSGGARVRKVTERQTDDANPGPRILKERMYVGNCEIYRTYSGDGQTKTLERETLHVGMGSDTIAMVETRTVGDEDGNPSQLTRYQLANYLNSVLVEVDDQAQVSDCRRKETGGY
jgi:YD repeat-containing protein